LIYPLNARREKIKNKDKKQGLKIKMNAKAKA